MKPAKRKNTGRKRGRKIVKVPHIHFDMKAIEEIKERKRRFCKR